MGECWQKIAVANGRLAVVLEGPEDGMSTSVDEEAAVTVANVLVHSCALRAVDAHVGAVDVSTTAQREGGGAKGLSSSYCKIERWASNLRRDDRTRSRKRGSVAGPVDPSGHWGETSRGAGSSVRAGKTLQHAGGGVLRPQTQTPFSTSSCSRSGRARLSRVDGSDPIRAYSARPTLFALMYASCCVVVAIVRRAAVLSRGYRTASREQGSAVGGGGDL